MEPNYDLIIRNATLLDPELNLLEGQDLAISDGKIAAIGPNLPGTSGTTLSGRGKLFMPGLTDGHTHLCQQFLRGRVLDALPMIWTRIMIPFESTLTPEAAEAGARLGCLEMIKSGTTAFAEAGGRHMERVTQAALDSGLRGALTWSTITQGDVPETMKCSIDEALRRNTSLYDQFHGAGNGQIEVFYSLRTYLSGGEDLIYQVFDAAAEHGTGVHMHLNEYPGDISGSLAAHQLRPIEYLASLGVLGPNLLAAHCIFVSDNEIDLIREHGIKVVHCPFSNCGKGVPPTPRLLQQGATMGLGTDGAAHGGLSLWNEMKIFRSVMNAHYGAINMDPTVMPAKTLLRMATRGGATALGLGDSLGALEPGYRADLISIGLDQPHILPTSSLVNTLVETVTAGDVRDSIVNGKLLMRDREVLALDEERVLSEARRIHAKLFAD